MSLRIPKYRLHKGSGQALVQIDGLRRPTTSGEAAKNQVVWKHRKFQRFSPLPVGVELDTSGKPAESQLAQSVSKFDDHISDP